MVAEGGGAIGVRFEIVTGTGVLQKVHVKRFYTGRFGRENKPLHFVRFCIQDGRAHTFFLLFFSLSMGRERGGACACVCEENLL